MNANPLIWPLLDAAGAAKATVIQCAVQRWGLVGWSDAREFLSAEVERSGAKFAVAIMGARS